MCALKTNSLSPTAGASQHHLPNRFSPNRLSKGAVANTRNLYEPVTFQQVPVTACSLNDFKKIEQKTFVFYGLSRDTMYTKLITAAAIVLHTTLLAASGPTLSLQDAVNLALLNDDPYLGEASTRAAALEDMAVADAQLADPKLRLNFANWPTHSFSYTQEPMTQVQLGLSQAFPKGNTLKYSREKKQAEAKSQHHLRNLRVQEITLDTRLTWLELYFASNARTQTLQNRQTISELIEVIEGRYTTGRQTQQDISRAQLELSLLDDRLAEFDQKISVERANLARRIGTAAVIQPLPSHLPAMQHPADLAAVEEILAHHPAAEILAANIETADKAVDIASEQYKPGWTLNVGYGARGGDRADFASVGVTMDVPLFTKNRQDKRVSAAKKSRQATRLSRDTLLLDLKKKLHVAHANWKRLGERTTLYQTVVLERAKETTEASLTSYQSGVSDFPELVRARLAELDAELKLLRLQTDRLKAQATLLFLEGEDDA